MFFILNWSSGLKVKVDRREREREREREGGRGMGGEREDYDHCLAKGAYLSKLKAFAVAN